MQVLSVCSAVCCGVNFFETLLSLGKGIPMTTISSLTIKNVSCLLFNNASNCEKRVF